MTQLMLATDIEQFPSLFDLTLPLSAADVEDIDQRLDTRLPPSYQVVLRQFGQGLLFDNESLLGAHEIGEGLGEIVDVNERLRQDQDLPTHLIVFHLGSGGLHAFDTSSSGPEYTVVRLDEDTLEPGAEYDDFDSWYVEYLREQYAQLLDLDH